VLVRVLTEQGSRSRTPASAGAAPDKGGLARSYTVTRELSRRQKSLNQRERRRGLYRPGPGGEVVQTEFGNAHQAAQPHLRPAFDGNVMKVLDGIKDASPTRSKRPRASREKGRTASRPRSQPASKAVSPIPPGHVAGFP
jgi:hypothetical protein